MSPGEPALTNATESAMSSLNTFGTLCNYSTGESIRPATRDELAESLAAAESDGGAGAFECNDGTVCYVEGGDAYTTAVAYLYDIDSETWERTCGNQTREEFAELTIDQGQTIETEWAKAVAHAESL